MGCETVEHPLNVTIKYCFKKQTNKDYTICTNI